MREAGFLKMQLHGAPPSGRTVVREDSGVLAGCGPWNGPVKGVRRGRPRLPSCACEPVSGTVAEDPAGTVPWRRESGRQTS